MQYESTLVYPAGTSPDMIKPNINDTIVKYQKNTVPDLSLDSLFKKCLARGILSIDDVMNSSKEDIMKSIVDSVHKYAIQRLSDGRYYTYVPDEKKPNGRRQVRKKSKAELYMFLVSFYGLTETLQARKTYGELFSEWVEYKKRFIGAPNSKKGLSASTIRRYQRDYDAYIKGTKLDETTLDSVTAIGIENFFLDSISAHQMSDRCAGNLFGYMNQSFDFAVRSGYMTSNPMVLADRQLLLSRCAPPPISNNSERVLTVEQMTDLRKEVLKHESENPGYLPDYAIELAMLTGMRLGELAALQWKSIDDRFIHIDYSEHRLDYVDRKSEIVVGEPKNRKHRLIPLTKDIRKLFERIKNAAPYDEDGFVFTDYKGCRSTARSIADALNRRARAIGMKHVSIHRIRRTVSSLLNQTLPQRDVAELLGHTERVNEMHYHYSTADVQEKVRAMDHLSHEITGIRVVKPA